MLSQDEGGFAGFLSGWIDDRREELAEMWIQSLQDRIALGAQDPPSFQGFATPLPLILRRAAALVADPGPASVEALTDELSRWVESSRQRGFGVGQLLMGSQLLARLLQAEAEAAARSYQGVGSDPLVDRVIATGRLRDATHLMGVVTAQCFSRWQGRYDREREGLLETFSQVLAHELGNRLGAAETAVRLLRSDDFEIEPDRLERLLDLALASISSGLRTVEDINALSKPLSPTPREGAIDLRLLIAESVRLARMEAETVGVTVDVEGEVPDVRVLGPHLRVALHNLLGNAIKFHSPTRAQPWVRLHCVVDGDDLVVCVADNGPGIAEDIREQVFHARYQGDADEQGSGLGLAITREAVERIGGGIFLETGEEGGTRLKIRVPVWSESAEAGL